MADNYSSIDDVMSVDPGATQRVKRDDYQPTDWSNAAQSSSQPVASYPQQTSAGPVEQVGAPNMSVAPQSATPNMSVAPPQKTGAELGVQGNASNMSGAPPPPNYSGPNGPVAVDAHGKPQQSVDGARVAQVVDPAPAPSIAEGGVRPVVTVRPALATREQVDSWKERAEGAETTEQSSLGLRAEAAQKIEDSAKTSQEELEAEKARHDAEMAGLQQRMESELADAQKRVDASAVDPTKYINDMSTGRKIMAILAVLLGGVGAALTRSDRNLALDVLNHQIDRDIDAQKSKLQTNKELLARVVDKYGSLTNWEIQRHAEAVAHISKVFELAAVGADSDKQRAAVLHDKAVLDSGAVQRGAQRALEGAQADSLTLPVRAGGGRAPDRLANRADMEAWLTRRTATDASQIPTVSAKVHGMSDQQLINAVAAAGGMPPASATGGGTQQSAEAKRDAELAAEEEHWNKVEQLALKRGDPQAATLASRRKARSHLNRVQHAEPNDEAVNQYSTNYESAVGGAARRTGQALGLSDDPSVRLDQYSAEVLGNK